jgi:Flp pilus assembly protein TadG
MPRRVMVHLGRFKPADQGGVALVEFALVLPLILLLLLGMIDVGKALNYWNDETHLANEAARAAAVNRSPVPGTTINDAVKNESDSSELRNGGTSSISSPGVRICIWFPNNFDTSDDPARDHATGDPVEVKVSAKYNWLAYLVGRGLRASSTITATSRMRLEKPFKTGATDTNEYTTGTNTATNDASGTC